MENRGSRGRKEKDWRWSTGLGAPPFAELRPCSQSTRRTHARPLDHESNPLLEGPEEEDT